MNSTSESNNERANKRPRGNEEPDPEPGEIEEVTPQNPWPFSQIETVPSMTDLINKMEFPKEPLNVRHAAIALFLSMARPLTVVNTAWYLAPPGFVGANNGTLLKSFYHPFVGDIEANVYNGIEKLVRDGFVNRVKLNNRFLYFPNSVCTGHYLLHQHGSNKLPPLSTETLPHLEGCWKLAVRFFEEGQTTAALSVATATSSLSSNMTAQFSLELSTVLGGTGQDIAEGLRGLIQRLPEDQGLLKSNLTGLLGAVLSTVPLDQRIELAVALAKETSNQQTIVTFLSSLSIHAPAAPSMIRGKVTPEGIPFPVKSVSELSPTDDVLFLGRPLGGDQIIAALNSAETKFVVVPSGITSTSVTTKAKGGKDAISAPTPFAVSGLHVVNAKCIIDLIEAMKVKEQDKPAPVQAIASFAPTVPLVSTFEY